MPFKKDINNYLKADGDVVKYDQYRQVRYDQLTSCLGSMRAGTTEAGVPGGHYPTSDLEEENEGGWSPSNIGSQKLRHKRTKLVLILLLTFGFHITSKCVQQIYICMQSSTL